MTTGTREWDGIYWRALVEASPDIILVIDLTGTILFVNRRSPFLGDREIVGRKIWEFAVGEARARIEAKLREVIAGGKALSYENAGFRPDGTPGWYDVRVVPVFVDGRLDRVLWASSDVSGRKQLEDQLRQSQKMDAIGQLAGGVAHDFNNLLAVIMGFGDLAARSIPAGHPVAEQLQEVIEAARRGGDLTRKLLAFSRKQILQRRKIDLVSTVTDFARVMRRLLGEDVEIVVEPAASPLVVLADLVQLEQVLMNLWTNARQAMPEGGSLHVATRPVDLDEGFAARNPWARPGAFAHLSIRDTGLGMDEATLARAFEPFFTTKTEGTGLGLSTVYGIVRQHDGFLHVESRRGAGTTVHVYLPRVLEVTPADTPRDPSPTSGTFRGSEVVLLAEDDPSLRALVERTLSSLGYRVLSARDGEEAIQLFTRHAGEIALTVLDVVMPRLDARVVYERIRALRPRAKVLFTTGYAPASTSLAELFAAGAVPMLEKPFTQAALATSVRRAIDGTATFRG